MVDAGKNEVKTGTYRYVMRYVKGKKVISATRKKIKQKR